MRTNTNRQRSKLAEASQEGERVVKERQSEKWVTRPRGGRTIKNFGEKKQKRLADWCKELKKYNEKRQNHVC
jgi:hypothetical protein